MESVTKIKHYARKKPKKAMHLSAMLILVLNPTTWSPIHTNTNCIFIAFSVDGQTVYRSLFSYSDLNFLVYSC